MTCEIAIMNRRGIALAADSAVTLASGDKVYYSAEKLFPLAGSAPVAIMMYGSDALMGVPWEIVIASYSNQLGDRRFGTLRDYADDFIEFIERANDIFPEEVQTGRFLFQAREIWQTLYVDPWRAMMAKPAARKMNRTRNVKRMLDLLREDHLKWEQYPPLRRSENFLFEDEDEDEPEAMSLSDADEFMNEIEDELCEIEEALFCDNDDLPFGPDLPHELREGLRTTLRHFILRGAFGGGDDTGLVFAGLGNREFFPSILSYRVGTMVRNRLKIMTVDEHPIDSIIDAAIVPFGQRETIDLVIDGIHPDLCSRLPELMEQSLPPRRKKYPLDEWGVAPDPMGSFRGLVANETQKKHSSPFLAAVAALPRHDLAVVAETLVQFSSFRMKFLANEKETVGGPIDVALLSKADGFVWVQHKRLSC